MAKKKAEPEVEKTFSPNAMFPLLTISNEGVKFFLRKKYPGKRTLEAWKEILAQENIN